MAWDSQSVYDLFERYRGGDIVFADGPLAAKTSSAIQRKARILGLPTRAHTPSLNVQIGMVFSGRNGLSTREIGEALNVPTATVVMALSLLFIRRRFRIVFNLAEPDMVLWLRPNAERDYGDGVWVMVERMGNHQALCIIKERGRRVGAQTYLLKDFLSGAFIEDLQRRLRERLGNSSPLELRDLDSNPI